MFFLLCGMALSFVKQAMISVFQMRTALSDLSSKTTGAAKFLEPLQRALVLGGVWQSVTNFCIYFAIYGVSDATVKIGM